LSKLLQNLIEGLDITHYKLRRQLFSGVEILHSS
jgi:hypothetical protein